MSKYKLAIDSMREQIIRIKKDLEYRREGQNLKAQLADIQSRLNEQELREKNTNALIANLEAAIKRLEKAK